MMTKPMDQRAAEIIRVLGLEAHPEGGYFREIHRSALTVSPDDGRSRRSALTAIFFLLVEGQESCWHRFTSDEVWHFYEGDTLLLSWKTDWEDAQQNDVVLGPLAPGRWPTAVIPAGAWQCAKPQGAYTLVGCTVGPGFDFADFEMRSQ